MKTFSLIIVTLFVAILSTSAQNYITKNGRISFFSKTDVENIDAENNQAVSLINSQNGEIVFSVLINGFLFKKALMQEHFNENYMESAQFPKGSFKGKILDLTKVNFTKDGSYKVSVSGDLTLHGETNKVTVPAIITVKGKGVEAKASFTVKLDDYKISIPKVVENNISKTIEINVDCNYTAR